MKNIIINEKQQNIIIREYLDKEYGMPLKKYFDDNCGNSDFILRRYFSLYRLFLKDEGYDQEYIDYFTVNDNDDPRINDLIKEVTPDKADDFYMWLYQNKMYTRHDPEASFFLTNPRLVKNQWLIHFTNRAEGIDICKNGFKMGVPKDKISQLAYTQKIKPEDKTSDGYIYAYDADKVFEGNLSLRMIENAPAAILFQGNGLKVRHETDREDQVIVLPQTVKNKVLLFQTDHVNGGWQVAKNNFTEEYCKQVYKIPEKLGNVLISSSEFNSLDNVISWVEQNYNQYKRVIGWDRRDNLKENKYYLIENSIDRKVNKKIVELTNITDFNEIRKIRAEILNKLPNARAKDCKWLPKIVEMFLNGEIPQSDYKVFNNFLGELHRKNVENNAILNNDRFLNLSYERLKEYYFNDTIQNIQQGNVDANKVKKVGNYTIYRVDNQEEANDMSAFFGGEWCILDDAFDDQVDDCTCYILKRDDFDDVHRQTVKEFAERIPHNTSLYEEFLDYWSNDDINEYGENSVIDEFLCDSYEYYSSASFIQECGIEPYDDYGYSAFVVLVGQDGRLYGVYSRYNMPNMQDGQFLGGNEISKLLGVDYKTVMPWVEKEGIMENKKRKKIKISENQEKLLIKENIKIHKGENGRKYSTQGKWDKEIPCPHCNGNAYFSMSISDGERGRGRIKVTDENGKEKDSEVQTIALYYCPNCYRFIARNNMA